MYILERYLKYDLKRNLDVTWNAFSNGIFEIFLNQFYMYERITSPIGCNIIRFDESFASTPELVLQSLKIRQKL